MDPREVLERLARLFSEQDTELELRKIHAQQKALAKQDEAFQRFMRQVLS